MAAFALRKTAKSTPRVCFPMQDKNNDLCLFPTKRNCYNRIWPIRIWPKLVFYMLWSHLVRIGVWVLAMFGECVLTFCWVCFSLLWLLCVTFLGVFYMCERIFRCVCVGVFNMFGPGHPLSRTRPSRAPLDPPPPDPRTKPNEPLSHIDWMKPPQQLWTHHVWLPARMKKSWTSDDLTQSGGTASRIFGT